jgi:hypothetical protein
LQLFSEYELVYQALTWASDVISTNDSRLDMRNLLSWLRGPTASLDRSQPHPLLEVHLQQFHRRYGGSGSLGSLTWRGYSWETLWSPLGPALVIMAANLPPDANVQPDLLRLAWRYSSRFLFSYC